MTDIVSTVYSLSALAPVDCGFGPTVPQITLSCIPDARIGIDVPQCIQSDGLHDWRIDGAKHDNTGIDFQSGGQFGFLQDLSAYLAQNFTSPQWMGRLLTGSSLLLEIKPHGAPPQIAEFDISGLAQIGPELINCALIPAGQSLPTSAPENSALLDDLQPASLEAMVASALACHETPRPGPILAKLEEIVTLDNTDVTGGDGIGCFEMVGGADILGMSFDMVCAYDDAPDALDEYSQYFSRGPGTSPGTRFALIPTSASAEDIEEWYTTKIRRVPNPWVLSEIEYYEDAQNTFTPVSRDGVECSIWTTD